MSPRGVFLLEGLILKPEGLKDLIRSFVAPYQIFFDKKIWYGVYFAPQDEGSNNIKNSPTPQLNRSFGCSLFSRSLRMTP
jgi:hypothetical protein